MTDDQAGSEQSSAPWAAPGHERHRAGAAAPGHPAMPAPAQGVPAGPPAPASWPPQAPHASSSAFAVSDAYRQTVFTGAGYSSPVHRNDRVAVAALILGVVGIVVPGICLFAVALGHLGLHRLRTSYDGGRGLAVSALVLGYITTALWLAVLVLQLISNAS